MSSRTQIRQDAGLHTLIGARTAVWAVLVGLILALCTVAESSSVHASQLTRTPADGSTLNGLPVLTWQEDPQALTYDVEISTSNIFSSLALSRITVTNRLTLDLDLAPATYYWRVRSNQIDGADGLDSAVWSFTRTSGDGPTLLSPADGAALSYPSEVPKFSWSPLPGVSGYKIDLDDNDAFSSPITMSTANTSYTPTTALIQDGSKTYYWRVRGVSASSGSVTTADSEVRAVSITWDPLARPTLLTPKNGEVAFYPDFTWTPVKGAEQYRLVVATDDQFVHMVLDQVVRGTEYLPTTALASANYFWKVQATDTAGTPGPQSDTSNFKVRLYDQLHTEVARPDNVTITGSAPTGPSVCSDVALDTTDTLCARYTVPFNKVFINWDPVAGASHYEVQFNGRSSFNDGPTNKVCKTAQAAITPYINGTASAGAAISDCLASPGQANLLIQSGKTYYIRVRAVFKSTLGSEVTSLWSNEIREPGESRDGLIVQADFTAADASDADRDLLKPATLMSPAFGEESPAMPTLHWKPIPGAGSYLVAIATGRDFGVGSQSVKFLDILGKTKPYYVTSNTYLIPQEQFPDNNAGESYYWYVLGCSSIIKTPDQTCKATDAGAINNIDPTIMGSFRKVGKPTVALGSALAPTTTSQPDRREPDETMQRLSWQDLQVTDSRAAGTWKYEVDLSRTTLDGTADLSTDATSLVLPQTYALAPGALYRWKVRAVDGTGLPGPWSAEQTFTPPAGSAPSGLVNPAAEDPTTPDLTWSAQSGVSQYQFEVYKDDTGKFPPSARVSVGGSAQPTTEYTSYSIPDWLNPGDYSWRVRSRDALGNYSEWNSTGRLTIAAKAPVLTSPAPSATVEATDLSLSWSKVAEVVKYRVALYREGAVTPTATSDVVGTEYTPMGSMPLGAGTYLWKVTSLIGSSGSIPAAESASGTFSLLTVPGVPSGVRASVAGTAVSLNWSDPPTGSTPPAEYEYRYNVSGGAWSQPIKAGLNANSVTIQGLELGTTYSFQIAGVNAVGHGKWSQTITAATPDVPSAPASVTTTPTEGGLSVSWSSANPNGTPLTGYSISYSKNGETSRVTKSLPVATQTTLTGLQSGATYVVYIRGINAAGLGKEASATSLAVLQIPKPGLPTSLRTAVTVPGRIGLSWAALTGKPKSVKVGYRKSGTTGAWTESTLSPTATSATVSPLNLTALPRGTAYDIRVYGVNDGGAGPAATIKASTANIPSAPTSVKASTASSRVTLTWVKPLNNGGLTLSAYVVSSSTNGTTWKTAATTSAGATSASAPGTKGKYLWVKVQAKNAVGLGTWSPVLKVKVA